MGSTAVRLVVAQVYGNGSFQTLDSLQQSVAIGSDTFTRGQISRSTIEETVKVLRNFSSVLAEYNIDLRKDVRAVATSAVREARNRDEFLDRVYMATDINVEVIEGTEVNRLTFLGIRPVLDSNAVLQRDRLLVAEVGGGSTELLGLENGRVAFAHTYRMGSYRLRETMDAIEGSLARRHEVLEMEIDAGIRQFKESVEDHARKPALLLLGGEARLTARLVNPDWDETTLIQIRIADLTQLAQRVSKMDAEKVAKRYHLSFEEAQALGPALEIHVRMAAAFRLKRVYICATTLRDGLLAEAAAGNVWSEDFVEQILGSVGEIGRKYQLDQAHADCVTKHALTLFGALADEHGLDYRYEVILTVAAQLHDIGLFIGNSSHHKHSMYLIENSDIFGLGKEDIRLTALVARYHRRALPQNGHPGYAALSRDKRLVVNKLAAVLRASDALDRSHSQAISNIRVVLTEKALVMETDNTGDFTAERRALADKGRMFEQVYGRTISLRVKRKRG